MLHWGAAKLLHLANINPWELIVFLRKSGALKFPVLAGGFILQMGNVNIRALQNLGRPAVLRAQPIITSRSIYEPDDVRSMASITIVST